MAELNKNKNQNNQLQVIFDWKHSSIFKQATFISARQNYCTKSMGKFPKKVAHASFLQCSVYIVLGHDDDSGKINLE